MDIATWLLALGLERYQQAFVENDIDGQLLHQLTDDDLRQIGVVSLGHRKKLLAAIGGRGIPVKSDTEPSSQITSAGAKQSDAERRQLTVMFVDLVGSTELSTRMDPEDLSDVIRAYQNTVAGEITRVEGHVAKFLGDGVLAYFGWPRAHENEAERAVRAGLAVLASVARLQAGGKPIACRIGIATGLVVVGELIGSGPAREEAVMGDTPNLAARLQSIAEPGQLVIAESTRQLIGELFVTGKVGQHNLKGLPEPVEVFSVLGERSVASRFAARQGGELPPIVGRDQELALLAERWRLAKAGEGQAIFLTGDAGIGKSRIAEALIGFAEAEPSKIMRFQCSPYHGESALYPAIQHLIQEAALTRNDSGDGQLDKLERLFAGVTLDDKTSAAPLIATLVGLDGTERYGPTELTPQQQRSQTMTALISYVAALASRQPVLWVIEDAHWIDPTTLELIEIALDVLPGRQVLLLVTARPTFSATFVHHPAVTRLALNRIARAATQSIVARIVGEYVLPDHIIDEIAARTDGVPLFVEEMTKAVVEARDDGLAIAAIPASLHDSLLARLDRLPGVREVAQTAACIGREFDYELLVQVAGIPRSQVDEALGQLYGAELVFRRGVPPATRHVFKHALVRDAAYASLLRSRRKAIHRSILNALTQRTEAVPKILIAQHAEEAGESLLAIECFLAAGQEATRRSANEEAIGAIARALELTKKLTSDQDRMTRELEARLALAVPTIAVRGHASTELETALSPALVLTRSLGDTEGEFAVLRALWNCIYDRGDLSQAEELSGQLLQRATKSGRGDWIRLARRAQGSTLYMEGRLVEAQSAFNAGVLADEEWSPAGALLEYGENPELISRFYLGYVDAAQGKVDSGLRAMDAVIAEFEAHDLPISTAFARAMRSKILVLRREPERCLENAEAVLGFAEKHGFVVWVAQSHICAGWAEVKLGAGEAGLRRMRRGIDQWTGTGAFLHVGTWSSYAADAALSIGDSIAANRFLSEGLLRASRYGEAFTLAELQRLRALLTLSGGDYRGAEVQLREFSCNCG